MEEKVDMMIEELNEVLEMYFEELEKSNYPDTYIYEHILEAKIKLNLLKELKGE